MDNTTEFHDYTGKQCGMIPEIQMLMDRSIADNVAFRVKKHMVGHILHALSTSTAWKTHVTEELDSSLITFTRLPPTHDDRLDLF